ncbi:putative aluminum-activated malate transporter [Medicago truncatula]|uniref:Aluminum activated malate transporter family protein n=1 Tax=Medicago truncatula TaxID=3880 RepID=A0A072U214_MEDTR|nr:aluminum-activated malate transporter 2 [Medicago truncatula]KEH23744.1 aluminum activated malate transporter family protein [Medicago truncatula]RHN48064.1 putative aluminum-activated malate transporter [Medicago truncatula]
MESSHVISIANEEDNNNNDNNIAQMKNETNTHLEKNKNLSFVPITSNPKDKNNKQIKSDHDIKKMVHSIKVGISLVLVSLLYILNPLFDQVGENAMWAIMTVVVISEFNAGATLGKGLNRGIGTIVGGGLGCLAAIFAQSIGGVGNSIFIGTSVYIFGSVATYFRLVPKIKNRYDYGVVVFMLTFNLVVVSGARPGVKVWELARERLLNILMGFIIAICVNLFVFPLWASDELHDSIVSRFHNLANTIQGCLEECSKTVKENQPDTSFTVCKSVLNSKSKDESLANFAKWEPWHGKFGFSYPWQKYLKIGEVIRELAALILALERCFQASKKITASLKQPKKVQLEQCEAIGSRIVWTLREVGDSMKQMRKCEGRDNTIDKLKTTREELSLVISTSMIEEFENGEMLPIASLVFLLMEVVEKVGELVIEVGELQDMAGFRTR